MSWYRHDRRGVMSRKRPDQALIDAARHKALAVSLATSRVRARLAAVAYNEGLQRVLPGTNVVAYRKPASFAAKGMRRSSACRIVPSSESGSVG